MALRANALPSAGRPAGKIPWRRVALRCETRKRGEKRAGNSSSSSSSGSAEWSGSFTDSTMAADTFGSRAEKGERRQQMLSGFGAFTMAAVACDICAATAAAAAAAAVLPILYQR